MTSYVVPTSHPALVPTVLAEGLIRVPAPALPAGSQIRCIMCGCSTGTDHQPNSEDCRLLAEERRWKDDR